MAHRLGLDRFKKAQSAEPFKVEAMPIATPAAHNASMATPLPLRNTATVAQPNGQAVSTPASHATTIGGGQSTWQPPDWAADPKPGMYTLEVLKDGNVVDTIVLERKRSIFGRQAATCDFVLDHPSLSRQHAALVHHKNGRMYVIDLGSVHGTFVSSERVTKETPVEFEPGQSVRFAASTRVYVLRKAVKNTSIFTPDKPLPIELPPAPDLQDAEAVLAYNTMLNRLGVAHPNNQKVDHPSLAEDRGNGGAKEGFRTPGSRKRKTPDSSTTVGSGSPISKEAKHVSFRDECGGELAVVVGVSDGADVSTEPGPIGVKEGSSLVGKFDSLVQTTVIPRDPTKGKPSAAAADSPKSTSPGVTDSLKEYLNRVKSPGKGGLYGGLFGETTTTFVGGSWGGMAARSSNQQTEARPEVGEEEKTSSTPRAGEGGGPMAETDSGQKEKDSRGSAEEDDDDLFGDGVQEKKKGSDVDSSLRDGLREASALQKKS